MILDVDVGLIKKFVISLGSSPTISVIAKKSALTLCVCPALTTPVIIVVSVLMRSSERVSPEIDEPVRYSVKSH